MATTITVQGVEDIGGVKRKVSLVLSIADINNGYPQFGDVPGTIVIGATVTPLATPQGD